MKNKTLIVAGALLVLSTAVALFSEEIDLYFSNLVFNGDFYLKNNVLIEVLDKYTEILICLLFMGCIGLWGLTKINIINVLSSKKMTFLIISLFGWCAALPQALKHIYHRARPFQSDLYFGGCQFTHAFERSTCETGDSFISGHTSFAVFILAFALILPSKIRNKSIIAAVFIILSVGISRILGGYHFFTDVYFALLLVGGGIVLTYRKMFVTTDGYANSIRLFNHGDKEHAGAQVKIA